MAAKKTTKKSAELSANQKISIGVGLTTAAVAAAGAYFLYGSPNAKKNRKTVKSWMLKAKAEVLEGLEKAEQMTEAEYAKLVETVSGTYAQLKDASKVDISAFKKEMKDHWPKIAKQAQPKAKKTAKKVSKKATKKVVTATPKKATQKAT